MGIYVDIKKNMNNFILDVSFEIEDETLALLGASGSGKSMTLKCIAGTETPDEGKIVLDDCVLFDSKSGINLPPQRRGIGYLFQNYALFPNMTVEENIQIAMKLKKHVKNHQLQEKISMFRLEGLEKKIPKELSGGQQQRVALARMLAAEPKILMLDEPFSALDSFLKWQLEQEIIEIIEAYHKPTLFVSHNRDEVYRISQLIGIMEHGKMQTVGKKSDLYKNPITLSGARLTGCKNFSKAKKVGENLIFALDWNVFLQVSQTIPLTENLYVGVRAHEIEVVDSKDSDSLFFQEKSNEVECCVLKTIENANSMMVLLKPLSVERTDTELSASNSIAFHYNYELWMEITKKEWSTIKAEVIRIRIHSDKILLLKETH